jgi:hypothetical protein
VKRTEIVVVVLVVGLVACLCLSVGAVGAWLAYSALNAIPQVTGGPSGPTPIFQPRSLTPTPLAVASPPPARAGETLAALENAQVPINDLVELASRLGGKRDVPRVIATSADPIPLGTQDTFNVSNSDTDENFQVTATLRYATAHVYFWVENGVQARDADIRALVDQFENKSYPTDREFFGSEWTPGVDGDPHLYILYTTGMGSHVAGYFSTADEYSPLAHLYSNGHEMFCLNADNTGLTEDFTSGVLAHEFQHMIHWKLDRNEESWINEGASELAAFLNGFDLGGFDQAYAANTDVQFNYWPDEDEEDTSPHYGVGFLFLDYYLNRFGAEATQTLVRAEANGLESIDQALAALGVVDDTTGRNLRSEDLFAEFAAALYLNDPAVADGRYAFANYPQAPQPQLAEVISDCPTGVQDRDVAQFGIDYIQIRCSGNYQLRFAGASTVSAIPVDPASGDYAAWSNRGDESDMTLTRAFDLPNSGPVTLDFKMWYDIEENWDYAYAEVSTDEGQTWTILHTPSGTDANPQGNNYGWAYTGLSGGGSQAEWIDEQVDLSAYAGQHVLIRFEYITDAVLNKEGLLLDDIRLQAAGYSTDFENDLGGWQAQGFVRLQNVLPQSYEVLLIKEGRSTTVTPLVLDERMTGEAPLVIGSGERAILVVIGSARFTRQRAPYQFEIVP